MRSKFRLCDLVYPEGGGNKLSHVPTPVSGGEKLQSEDNLNVNAVCKGRFMFHYLVFN